jgi:hypothetical protein
MASRATIKRDLASVEGFNAKFALLLTRVVGTMACFYLFNVIAIPALYESFKGGGLIPIINAVSSNWLQLILLPALMVGQNLQAVASDRRAAKTFEDTETIIDRLDVHTEGGLKVVLDRVTEVHDLLAKKAG